MASEGCVSKEAVSEEAAQGDKTCDNGHELTRFDDPPNERYHSGFVCRGHAEINPCETGFYHCDECSYDLCLACFSKEAVSEEAVSKEAVSEEAD